jgi:O-acetyl-ADP-ribose deacetylase (regulator of RNase III)
VIAIAAERGLATLAFPAISAGAYGYPPEAAAEIAIREVRAALAADETFESITFVLFGAEMLAIYEKLLEATPAQ